MDLFDWESVYYIYILVHVAMTHCNLYHIYPYLNILLLKQLQAGKIRRIESNPNTAASVLCNCNRQIVVQCIVGPIQSHEQIRAYISMANVHSAVHDEVNGNTEQNVRRKCGPGSESDG